MSSSVMCMKAMFKSLSLTGSEFHCCGWEVLSAEAISHHTLVVKKLIFSISCLSVKWNWWGSSFWHFYKSFKSKSPSLYSKVERGPTWELYQWNVTVVVMCEKIDFTNACGCSLFSTLYIGSDYIKNYKANQKRFVLLLFLFYCCQGQNSSLCDSVSLFT